MAYVLIKRGRFLTGHSYATGIGYSFSWSADESKARRFSDADPTIDGFCNQTGARTEYRQNTREELREIGRERLRIRQSHKPQVHPSDAKINRRAALSRVTGGA